MAEIKVELQADDINKAIADAIVKSVLGDAIVKLVNETVSTLTRSYDNPVKKLVEQLVKDEILKLITSGPFAVRIHEQVKAQLSDDMIEKVVAVLLDKIVKTTTY